MADNKAQALEWKGKGNAALKTQDFDEAISCYTKAIELDDTNHVFFSNRSAAYLSKGMGEEALADGEACIKVNPSWPKGYSRKGAALHNLQRYDEAITAFEDGLKVDASSAMLKDGLKAATEAKAAANKGPFGPDMMGRLAVNPKFREYMQDPGFMAKLQMLQTNPSALQGMMGSDPRIMEVLSFLLGIDLQAMGGAGGPGGPGGPGAASAPASAAPAPAEVPEEPTVEELTEEQILAREKVERAEAKKQEGNAFYKKKKFDEAIRCYDEAYEINNENILILNNKAAVYFAQKNFDKCVEICREAIARGREVMADFKDIAKVFARLGNAEQKRGDLAAALQAYDDSLMEAHSDDVYTRRKKLLKLKKKRDEESYWDDEKAAAAKAEGNAFFKEGKWPQAIKSYTEAIKRNPKSAVYYQNRASTYMKVMDYPSALSDAKQAVKLDPTYLKAYYRLGMAQVAMKEFHKALDTYNKALKIDPEDVQCKQGLADCMRRINMASSGEADQERVARAQSDPEIQAILRDPIVQQTLQSMQTDPTAARKAMLDPSMGPKIQKLIAAGILRTG